VDALSHALIAIIILTAIGMPAFIPFAVMGAVIMDADIFYPLISGRDPRLYLFSHGGIAHSIAGAFVLSVLAYLAIAALAAAGVIVSPAVLQARTVTFAIILSAAFLHLFIDLLACPGIPLLAPFTDRKYTPGLLPGPSVLLMGSAIGVLVPAVSGLVPVSAALGIFAVITVMYLAVRLLMFLYAAATVRGRRVPTISPFRWLVINEDDDAFTVRHYAVLRGFSEGRVFSKFRNTSRKESGQYLDLPEVRRLRFNSYLITAERTGPAIIFSDPLRENGYIYYPPDYKRVALTAADVP
jgi:inner membrane protein